jgi:hypothetical protein
MFNLIISGNRDSWNGQPFLLETNRFLEYTDDELKNKFKDLTSSNIKELTSYPCIFAFEYPCNQNPLFGQIKKITARKSGLLLTYEIIQLESFLTFDAMNKLDFELDISINREKYRTHWAIKNVNLYKELFEKGIILPKWCNSEEKIIDVSEHNFDVALSFPGEIRASVLPIANELENYFGKNTCFYDDNYKAQLARPSLDLLLQNIYKERCLLIVVFLCKKYQEKKWCGIEFNAIRTITFEKKPEKIMYIKMDNGTVEGVFSTDGYIDGQNHSPSEIANFIITRVELLKQAK